MQYGQIEEKIFLAAAAGGGTEVSCAMCDLLLLYTHCQPLLSAAAAVAGECVF